MGLNMGYVSVYHFWSENRSKYCVHVLLLNKIKNVADVDI